MSFVSRHYTLPVTTSAVLRAADLELYASARVLLEQAKLQAAEIVEQARAQAALEVAVLRQQEQEAQACRRSEDEQRSWAQAQQLEVGYQALRQQLTQALTPLLDQALTQVLQHLALQTDAVDRLRAVTAALARCVPNALGATLWISGADAGLLPTLGELPWAIEISATLAAGHCSLVGSGGAWQCDFASLLARVAAPLKPLEEPGAD